MKDWIRHLQHPLVLVGFALFAMLKGFELFFADTLTAKFSGTALEGLVGTGMTYLFVLAGLCVLGGTALSWRKAGPAATKNDLTTQGGQSPSIRSGGKVTVSYSGKLPERKNSGSGKMVTQGEQSPAVEAEKDVEIRYEK